MITWELECPDLRAVPGSNMGTITGDNLRTVSGYNLGVDWCGTGTVSGDHIGTGRSGLGHITW